MTEATAANEPRLSRDELNPYLGNEKVLQDLLGIVGDALKINPPLYPNSILGHPWTWLPPHSRLSEYSIVNPFELIQSVKYLTEVTVPALPIELPDWLLGGENAVFWRGTDILFQSDPENNPYSFPDEAWIFINGVGTNSDMARINADLLSLMFRRPLTIIQNATNSIVLDLLQSVIGKAWQDTTEASVKAYPIIHNALHTATKKRVVVICHSQGTIIMANVLRALIDEEFREMLQEEGLKTRAGSRKSAKLEGLERHEDLEKLEIYSFANCSDVMRYAPGLKSDAGNPVPFLENFANELDLVARTGILAPRKEKWGIKIDGDVYAKARGWGHLLNLHYLMGIRDHLENPKSVRNPYASMGADPGDMPRLYKYFNGGVPEAY
jgi:hypothetical protein